MKEQLPNLYLKGQRQFKDIITQFPDDDLAGPFLMSPNSLYAFQENPLLIVGQETCAWENSIDDLNKQMKFYEVFNVGIDYKSTPFWNITRKVEAVLGNIPYSCAWTNISKFDFDGGRAYGIYEKASCDLDEYKQEFDFATQFTG